MALPKITDKPKTNPNLNLYSQDLSIAKPQNEVKAASSVVPETAGLSTGSQAQQQQQSQPQQSQSGLELYKYDQPSVNQAYADEIQKAAEERNYKTLLQSDIAAYNLKMQSKKYLDNMLENQGLGNQGYGTTAHAGIDNQALNLYSQNLADYNQKSVDLASEAAQRKEAALTERDNQLFQFLTQTSDGTDASITNIMNDYGYYQDKDGKWVNKETGEEASSYILGAIDTAKSYASSAIPTYSGESSATIVQGAQNALKNWASTYEGVDKNGYSSVENLGKAVVGSQDNSKTDTLGNVVPNELNAMQSMISSGVVQDGTLFKLQRGNGHHEAYLVLYLGGKLYVVSDNDNEQDEDQVNLRYSAYQGPKYPLIGK